MLTKVRRFLATGNLARFLVALVLAFALWAYVTNQNDPEITKLIPALPVTASEVAPQLRVIGPLDTVEVTIQGPRSRVETIATGSVVASVDLGDTTEPGTYFLSVHVEAPSGVRVRDVAPSKIQVQVEAASSGATPSPVT